jgi:hypothetical protein
MSLPYFANQNSPAPEITVIRGINLHRSTPKAKEEIRVIESDKMHDIEWEYVGIPSV